MADLTVAGSYYQTYNNAGSGVAELGDNAYKMIGDGAAGVGPYTRFSLPQLTAISVTSAAVNFTTTPAGSQSNLQKAVNALQAFGEIHYVGKPTASGSNVFVVLLSQFSLNTGGQGAAAFGGTDDQTPQNGTASTFESAETVISLALGQAVTDITIAEVVLTGLTFA